MNDGISPDVKSKILGLALLPALLGGCASETASYVIGPEQALTIVREKAYPWDDAYMRAVVVMSRPKCIMRYKLPEDPGDIGKVEIYDGGEGYFLLKDKAGQYLANLADCSMGLVEGKVDDPGELKGAFEMAQELPPRFVAAAAKPRAPAANSTNTNEKAGQ